MPTASKVKPAADPRSESAGLKVATRLSLKPEAAPAPASAAPGPVVIEKQPRLTSPRERADHEYRKAVAALNQGRAGEAQAGLRAALQEDPAHVQARLALAGLLVEQRQLAEAQALLQEGLGHSPGSVPLALKLARIQVERGELRAAAETLHRNLAGGAASAEYRGFHAGVLQRLEQHRAAAEEYQAALRLAPQVGVWWMGLGISLEADGRPAEAREAFQRARASGSLSAELERYVEQRLAQLQ